MPVKSLPGKSAQALGKTAAILWAIEELIERTVFFANSTLPPALEMDMT